MELILLDDLKLIRNFIYEKADLITTSEVDIDFSLINNQFKLKSRVNQYKIQEKTVILHTNNPHKLIHLLSATGLFKSVLNCETIILLSDAKYTLGVITSDDRGFVVPGLNLIPNFVVSKHINELNSHNPGIVGLDPEVNSVLKIRNGEVILVSGQLRCIRNLESI